MMNSNNTALIFRYLDALRRRLKRIELFSATNYLFSVILLVLLGGVAADHALALPFTFRLIYFILLCFGISAFLYIALLRPMFRKTTHAYCAMLIESKLPNLSGNLRALAELPDKNSIVADALAERSIPHLENSVPADFVPIKPFLRSLLFVAVALVCFFGYATFSAKSTIDSLLRLLAPAYAIAAPTATKIIEVYPGNKKILTGSTVLFTVKTDGLEPSHVKIVRQIDGKSEPIEVVKTNLHTFEGVLSSVLTSFEYSITAGDAKAGPYTLTALPIPTVTQVVFDVNPPAYSGEASFSTSDTTLQVLFGSSIQARLLTATPIKSATMLSGSSVNAMQISTPSSAIFTFVPEKSENVSFFYVDHEGYASDYTQRYSIVVMRDAPPKAEIKFPLSGTTHPVNVPLNLIGFAEDDFALSEVAVRWSKNFKSWHSEPYPASGKYTDIRMTFTPSGMGWLVGDEITFAVYAKDNCQPDNNETISDYVTIKISKQNDSDMPPPDDKQDRPQIQPPADEKPDPQTPDEVEKKLDEMQKEDKDAIDKVEDQINEGEGDEKKDTKTPQEKKDPATAPDNANGKEDTSDKPKDSPQSNKDDGKQDDKGNGDPDKPEDKTNKGGDQQPDKAGDEKKDGNDKGNVDEGKDKQDTPPQPADDGKKDGQTQTTNTDDNEDKPADNAGNKQGKNEGNGDKQEGDKGDKTDKQDGKDKNKTDEQGKQGDKQNGQNDKQDHKDDNDKQDGKGGLDKQEGNPDKQGDDKGKQDGADGKQDQQGDKSDKGSKKSDQQGDKTDKQDNKGDMEGQKNDDSNKEDKKGEGQGKDEKDGKGEEQPNQGDGKQDKQGKDGDKSGQGDSDKQSQGKGQGANGNKDGKDEGDGEGKAEGTGTGDGKNGESDSGSSTHTPGGGVEHPGKQPSDKISDLLDNIDKAMREGKITEADLQKMGLSKERLDEYRKLLRLKKLLSREVAGNRDSAQGINAGDTAGQLGAHDAKSADAKDKTSDEAKRATEKVTGGYRELIDAFKKSIEDKK